MERTFAREVKMLRRGDGEYFEGEGILAITKALLQSGVSYVGGYQGAPVSHLMDVLTSDSKGLMAELGSHQMDAASIFLGKKHPLAVQGYGGKIVLAELAEGHSTTATIARLTQ